MVVMGSLTRDEIFSRDDAKKTEKVHVPEWGGDVYVRVMTARERDALDIRFKDNRVGMRAFIACMLTCDESGNDLFHENQGDMQKLDEKSGRAIDRILEVALRLNGMTQESIEDAEKN